MFDNLVKALHAVIGSCSFGLLVTIVLEFVHVPEQKKCPVTRRTMALILACLMLVSVGSTILIQNYETNPLDNAAASAEPSIASPGLPSAPIPSLPIEPEPQPTADIQPSAPVEIDGSDTPAPMFPPETPSPSPILETPSPTPASVSGKTFVLDALDDLPQHPIDFHCEYRSPSSVEFELGRFPLELSLEPGYYYVKIHKDGSCRLLAQTSFYVDDSVAGYAVGFRRILSWGLYDAGEVDEDCLQCSWGYRPVPSANLSLTLADGAQYSASGLNVRIHCEGFSGDIFSCTYQDGPLWFSLPPGLGYNVTVYFDGFVAAEGSIQLTAPQNGTSPQTLQIQLT